MDLITRYWRYLTLRKSIYSYEIEHWLKQFEHLMVLIILFLGTAIPALLYFVLLAYGVILSSPADALNGDTLVIQKAMLVIWCILVAQSIVITLCKPAILGQRNHFFIRSVEPSRFARFLSDTLLALFANPFVIILLFILANIELERWFEAAHGFLLLLLQVSTMLVATYLANRIWWVLSAFLIMIPIVSGFTLTNILLLFLLVMVALIILLPEVSKHINVNSGRFFKGLPISISVWWHACMGQTTQEGNDSATGSFSGQAANGVCLSASFSMLVVILAYYCGSELPQYASVYYFVGGQMLVLSCISLQLSINKTIHLADVFFAQFSSNKALYFAQFIVPLGSLVLTLLIAAMLFEHPRILVMLGAGLISLYFAKNHPKYFMLAWVLSAVVSALLYFNLW